MLEILSWVFLIPTIIGAFLLSGTHPKRQVIFTANLLFTISNCFNLVFMIFNFHWGYLVLYIILLGIGIRGMYLNRKIRFGVCQVCKERRKINFKGWCIECWEVDLKKLLEE